MLVAICTVIHFEETLDVPKSFSLPEAFSSLPIIVPLLPSVSMISPVGS